MSLASDNELKGAWNEALTVTSDKMQDSLFNYSCTLYVLDN